MADVCQGEVFGTGTREPVKGSGDRVRSVGVQGSFVFCDSALNGDRPVDVTDMDEFVVTEVLSIALIGPAVHEFLPGDFIQVLGSRR